MDTMTIFPVEFRDIIIQYTKTLRDLFIQYDVVIFMARKAICFYKALKIAGLIERPDNCIIYSSRVLNYNIYEKLKNKRVLLIEDVMVRGVSVRKANEYLSEHGIKCDTYIMTRTQSKKEDICKGFSVIGSDCEMSKEDVHRFSKYIADFIEANMCPYNIDQPIYKFVKMSKESIYDFIKTQSITDIGSDIQKQFGIESYLIDYKNCFDVSDPLYNVVNLCKIRFLYNRNTKQLIVIPFVILGELKNAELDNVFFELSNAELKELVENDNELIFQENKLKVVHYLLAVCLMNAFKNYIGIENIQRIDENDTYVFTDNVLFNPIYPITINKENIINHIEFDYEFVSNAYLSIAFDYLYSNRVYHDDYYSSNRDIIKRELIILEDLKNIIKEKTGKKIDEYIFSHIIDILIDKGYIIPSVIHRTNDTIIRAYKCGEVYALHSEHFNLFTYGLSVYLKEINKQYLGKIEFEKLCVLFFRHLARNNIISIQATNGCSDAYSICYSKFGPRVSSTQPIYCVEEEATLANKLIKLKRLKLEDKDKPVYEIEHYDTIENELWIKVADNFFGKAALNYNELFNSNRFKDNRNMYVKTYNDYLILLAIGINKKDQLLSLLAELYLFEQAKTNGSLNGALKECGKIMDGLVSGMWKYMCYSSKVYPLDSIKTSLNNNQDVIARSLAFQIEDTLLSNPTIDTNKHIHVLLDNAGKLIYTVTYLVWFLMKKNNLTSYVENIEEKRKREFYYKDMKDIRKSLEDLVTNGSMKEEDFLELIHQLQRRAREIFEDYNTHIGIGFINDNTFKNVEKMIVTVKKGDEKGMGDFFIEKVNQVNVNNGDGDQIIYNESSYIDFQKYRDQMKSELEQAKASASKEEQVFLEEAIQSICDGKESNLHNVLKRASDFFKNVFASVVGSVVYQYMKQNQII